MPPPRKQGPKPKTGARMRPATKAGPRPKRAAPKKKAGPRVPRLSIVPALDARLQQHVSADGGSYTVLRGRVNVTKLSSTSVGQYEAYLIGPHTVLGGPDNNVSNCISVNGFGGAVPGANTDNLEFDPIVTFGNVGGAQMSLHAITISLKCTGGSTLMPDGITYAGALRGRARRTAYGTWDLLSKSLITRNELRSFTNYELMKGVDISAFPLDKTQWSSFGESSFQDNTTKANNISLDSLSPIVIVLPATISPQGFTITIYTEWRCMFNIENVALASTHRQHQLPPPKFWNDAAAAAGNVGGHIHGGGGMKSSGSGIGMGGAG